MNRLINIGRSLMVVAMAAWPLAADAQWNIDCESGPGLSALDFWVGEWDVFVGETRIGENRIEKIVGGCAITERWQDARGSSGFSLFYFRPASMDWRQVWVTDAAAVKEKRMVGDVESGRVRFLGELVTPEGVPYFDRTTLVALGPDTVRQTIEVSADGKAWRTVFDAQYRRK